MLAKRQSGNGNGNATAHSCQFSRTGTLYLQKFCTAFCSSGLEGSKILFVDFVVRRPESPARSASLPVLPLHMLNALPALGGSANCLSTHQIVMSFVFDILVVQNRIQFSLLPTLMHNACDELAETAEESMHSSGYIL